MKKRYHTCSSFLAVVTLLGAPLAHAGVPAVSQPPSPPSGYCSTIYNELDTDLAVFNQLMQTPPTWSPVSLGPTVYAANLQVADANTGTGLAQSNYLASVMPQLLEEQAMGAQAVLVQIGFPALYAPFYGGGDQMAPYLAFYSNLASTIRQMGMKLIVENDILLSNDIQAGWPNLTQFFNTLSWNDYIPARAQMAATIAENLQPDYMVVAEEPDTEAAQAGQPNLLIPADAAQMITAEVAAVRASTFPNVKLGAGFGAWSQANNPNSVAQYTAAYVQLPIDYLDSHIYPINNSVTGPVIDNILTIASGAAQAGMPISMSEAWVWKMEDSELGVLSADTIRGRNAFSFWGPIDVYFAQTMQTLANYTDMVFLAEDGPDYLFTYQTFGGTTQNGGMDTCTCTTQFCDAYDIVQTETQLAKVANQSAQYSATGIAMYNSLVPVPDTIAPSTPTNVTASAAYSQATLQWTPSTDNIGVAGYNVLRCSPATLNGPCTPVQLAVTTTPAYTDQTLTPNTYYNYVVQAFDLANNLSLATGPVSILTYRTSAASPTGLTATAASAQEIKLSWTAPTDTNGLSQYMIFAGSSPSNMVQVANTSSTKTTYNYMSLAPGTVYYFGVEAAESGLASPMSTLASVSTLPLPNPPDTVTATAVTPTEITVSWHETMAQTGLTIANYQVWAGTTPGQFTKIATVTSGTTYTNRSLQANTTYYYEIVAADTGHDNSLPSIQVQATTLPMPPAPTKLTANTPAATQIVLSWQWSPLPRGLAAARYLVNCGTSPTGLSQVGTAVSSPTYTYRSAIANTTYYCDIVTVDSSNDDSPASAQVVITTPPMPNAPTAVSAVASSATKVTVTWNEVIPPNGLGISNYAILRGTNPNSLSQVATRTTGSYIDTTVQAGQTYYYAITASDTGHDTSARSQTANVTTP